MAVQTYLIAFRSVLILLTLVFQATIPSYTHAADEEKDSKNAIKQAAEQTMQHVLMNEKGRQIFADKLRSATGLQISPRILRNTAAMFAEIETLDMLLISGGGSFGPWTTGVLKGWDDAADSDRPDLFAVVTGVSTGAMIAPFAYLHDNENPDYVRHANDIHRKRLLIELPFSDSLYSLNRLGRLIYKFMDPPSDDNPHGKNLLQRIADTYDDGDGVVDPGEYRLLIIGTVSMDSGAFCAWNLGEIARRWRDSDNSETYRKLFHDVLWASAAMPGFHSPVRIDVTDVPMVEEVILTKHEECDSGLHADGGLRRQVFVDMTVILKLLWEEFEKVGTRNAYVMVNRKVVPPRKCPQGNSLIDKGTRALEVMTFEGLLGSLYRIRHVLSQCFQPQNAPPGDSTPDCLPVGFKLSYIPHDAPFEYGFEEFPEDEMQDLHNLGIAWGKNPTCDATPISQGWCEEVPEKEASDLSCTEKINLGTSVVNSTSGTIEYLFDINNPGSIDISDIQVLDPAQETTISCLDNAGNPISTFNLPAGGSKTCTGTYPITGSGPITKIHIAKGMVNNQIVIDVDRHTQSINP